jgi:2-polyprenyl-3-methyl-5-hydroxy-6-metoxy-1,4-benzoquinol methylase
MSDVARSCWCGQDGLRDFGPGYLLCTACNTLVGQEGLSAEETVVGDDEVDYYGKRYWLEHQRDELGLPDIHERARLDLPERCVHWLKALLRYRRPPARVLEIGAGHGAYTALLQWAGYDATALDLSPWVAEFARERFGISYLVGPVQQHELAARSFDVVVANDVLEHLADPREAVRSWAALLKTDGLLVIQTPEFIPERSYETLVADEDLFLEHMQRAGTEHLYLFSRASIRSLFSDVGLGQLSFEEPVYAYDMYVVAGATLPQRVEDDPAERVSGTPLAPLVTALIDVHDSLAANAALLAVSEADRQARLEVIERLDAALKESEAARRQRLNVSDGG